MPALEHRNTLVFLNAFVTQTAQFLNRFSAVCEEVCNNVYCSECKVEFTKCSLLLKCALFLQRLGELSLRIQRLDISLNILEAKVRKLLCRLSIYVFVSNISTYVN